MTPQPVWPDDIGAHCPEVPDAISFRQAAREMAGEIHHWRSEDEAYQELVAGFWAGEFGAGHTSVFTLQRRTALTDETTIESPGLLPEAERVSDADEPPHTLIRKPVYWAPAEYAGFIARFWYVGDEGPSVDLPDLPTTEERLRWLAALPLAQYPPAARRLLGRLHISRAALERWITQGDKPRRAQGGRERSYWSAAEAELLRWLDDEGEPSTLAEAERMLADTLGRRGHHPVESTIRTHATRCLDEHRARRLRG